MNILLMGYYGFHNVGDDLFLRQLIDYFAQKQEVNQIFVFCQEDYYERTTNKARFFAANQLSKLKRLAIIIQSDCLMWGGGTLNIKDKPTNLLRLQSLAKWTGKKFCFLGVGLETMNSDEKDRKSKIFKNADLLYLRDKQSYEVALQKLKPVKAFCLGGDLAFLDLNYYQPYIKENKSSEIRNISFSGKFWWGEGRGEFYGQQLMQFVEKYNSVIHLLPAHVGEERNDNKFHHLLKKYLPESNYKLYDWKKPAEFIEILSQMDFHFGNRLHSIILADILGVPSVGISGANTKIQHYIDKSEVLPELRLLDFMEPIEVNIIEKIFREYEKPTEFILNESKTAKAGVELVFQKG
ncbi:MAG: polysaccharide pyruvyl transferase family protein [Rivularia sp. T60_A2020_040]|nr:polysaccharide pyruvyl transferase family protein [Rivularia sp. T60_A2020_040]